MELSGEQHIPASRKLVWEALNDPDILKACIPGCQIIEKLSDDVFTTTLIAKVGPVKATFKGKVSLSEIDEPNGYTITGEGQGGAAGFGKGGARVRLSEDGQMTILRYEAQGQVGGKLAQIGSRLVDAAAAQMAREFFERFQDTVSALASPPGTCDGSTGLPLNHAPSGARAVPGGGGKRSRTVWIGVGLIAAMLGVALYIMN